jgi:hypothetical protein
MACLLRRDILGNTGKTPGNFNGTFSPVTVRSSATLTPEEAAIASQARLPFI